MISNARLRLESGKIAKRCASMEPAQPLNQSLKREWTDQFVEVNPEQPELRRFQGIVGRVITVNCNDKALIDFQDGGWYDVSASNGICVNSPRPRPRRSTTRRPIARRRSRRSKASRFSGGNMSRRLTAVISARDGFVALCPELDIASQGDTVEAARDNLKEALSCSLSALTGEVQQRLNSEVFVTQVEVSVALTELFPMILLIDNYDSFTYNLVQLPPAKLDPTLDVQIVLTTASLPIKWRR